MGNDTERDVMNRDQLYNLFLERLEGEMAGLMGVDGKAKKVLTGRREGPKLATESCISDTDGGARQTTEVSRAWRRSAKWLTILVGKPTDNERKAAVNRQR